MGNYEFIDWEMEFDPYLQHRARQRQAMLMGANRCIRCRRYSFTDYAVCYRCTNKRR